LHAVLSPSWHVPLVAPLVITMQRAGGTHTGPPPAVEQASPSAAAAVQTPMAPGSFVLHVPLAAQAANW
jgi:hypothetical protein